MRAPPLASWRGGASWRDLGRPAAVKSRWIARLSSSEARQTGAIRRLTDAPPLNQMPVWSPDGRHIAFMSSRAGYPSVFRMDADGRHQVNLTPRPESESIWLSRAPSWSTNARQIYFMGFRPDTGGTWRSSS